MTVGDPRRTDTYLKADIGPSTCVIIEDNVWVGGQVSILPGVRIGRDSVVGIHAVVFEDVPPGVIVGGNPARVLRPLESGAQRG